ncbi:hypothetical protein V6N13_027147 [Hibiscus sabdariffa]
MGLRHDPVPSSSFSERSEASEEVIPQLYNGSAGFESAKDEYSVNFIDSHPQTGVLVSSGTDDFKFWTPNAIDKVVLPTQDELDRHYVEKLISLSLFLCEKVVERPLEYSSDEEYDDDDSDSDDDDDNDEDVEGGNNDGDNH